MFEVSKDDEVLIEMIQKMQRLPGVDRETVGFTIMQVQPHTEHSCHFFVITVYRVAQKSKPLPIYQNIVLSCIKACQ